MESRIELVDRWRREGREEEVAQFRDKARRECREKGMTKKQAMAAAWTAAIDQFPPQEPEPDQSPHGADYDAEPAGVTGLADLPGDWPDLPGNASLASEVQWVTANRLRVVTGEGVDLSLALSPAPSHSALSWLETAILFPAKFVDVSVKATSSAHDEQAVVKREKMAIEEVRGLLAEMLEDES